MACRRRVAAGRTVGLVLNALGYAFLRAEQSDLAIDVFRLNTEAYPQGFNAFDSLAEAYMETGMRDLAVANYRKSLEPNPDNANAVSMLQRLENPEGGP